MLAFGISLAVSLNPFSFQPEGLLSFFQSPLLAGEGLEQLVSFRPTYQLSLDTLESALLYFLFLSGKFHTCIFQFRHKGRKPLLITIAQ